MSQKITASESNYDTLTEAVAGALNNKEDCLLSLDATGKAVLFDGTKPATHVMVSRLQLGDGQVRARILGKNGTVRVIQNGAIVPGARVIGHGGTARVVTAAAGGRSLGFKMDRPGVGNGAAGDVIEIFDVVEPAGIAIAVAAPAALTSTDGTAAAAAAHLANLAAETEKVGDDVRALHATVTALRTALITQGLTS